MDIALVFTTEDRKKLDNLDKNIFTLIITKLFALTAFILLSNEIISLLIMFLCSVMNISKCRTEYNIIIMLFSERLQNRLQIVRLYYK